MTENETHSHASDGNGNDLTYIHEDFAKYMRQTVEEMGRSELIEFALGRWRSAIVNENRIHEIERVVSAHVPLTPGERRIESLLGRLVSMSEIALGRTRGGARENDAMLDNLTATQKRCTELLEEKRSLAARVAQLEDAATAKTIEHAGPFARAVTLVYEERVRQNEKWGRDFGHWHDSYFFQVAVLTEEVGEVAKALLEYEATAPRSAPVSLPEFLEKLRQLRQPIRDELVQVAAVAIAMLEAM